MNEAQELALAVKTWRGTATARVAAKTLGLPTRTLEGIEQGRGFRYPEMLKNALASVPRPFQPTDATRAEDQRLADEAERLRAEDERLERGGYEPGGPLKG